MAFIPLILNGSKILPAELGQHTAQKLTRFLTFLIRILQNPKMLAGQLHFQTSYSFIDFIEIAFNVVEGMPRTGSGNGDTQVKVDMGIHPQKQMLQHDRPPAP
jgi:hypothetical protein